MKILRKTANVLALSLMAMVGRCTSLSSPVAGGISDHGNARISCLLYRPDKTPLSNGFVRLRTRDHLADTMPFGSSDFGDKRTDRTGKVTFDSLAPGAYVLEALDSDSTIGLALSLSIVSTSTQIRIVDTARDLGSLSGTIDTLGLFGRSVYVGIKGMERATRVRDGQWSLGALPPWAEYHLVFTTTSAAGLIYDSQRYTLEIGEQKNVGQVSLSARLIDDTCVVRAILDSNGLSGLAASTVLSHDGKRVTSITMVNQRLSRIPDIIGRLDGLQELRLSGNMLSELPESLSACRRLRVLDVSYNTLGAAPSVVFELDSLRHLDLSYNQIADTFSALIGKLKFLDTLFIGANRIRRLPPELGSCTRLRVLSCDQNLLQTVPLELSRCSLLTKLNLNDNQIDSIPIDFSEWRYLRSFNAQVNRLRSLPVSLSQAGSLVEVRLHINRLTTLPFTAAQVNQFSYLTLYSNAICTVSDTLATALNQVYPGWRSGQNCPE